ncbi:MAG TPA: glycosyltransferase family 4 protein [Thermoleophilaceae bacterium]|nr:glycosyltransferase family 4 protein [Thermoleophilaceae bacterium]
MPATTRVLVLHNRYRIAGGEERSVELQLRALQRAGVEHRLIERRSGEAGRARAAAALLRGGWGEREVAAAVRDSGAGVVHVHNMLPLFGPRALSGARAAGASVVLHLHNLRLFCSIAVAARDGGPCFRCHGRLTLPGLVLNCRGSLPESAAYTAALALHQPRVLEAVDRFVAPSHYAAGQLALLGLPRERIEVLAHYLPEASFAERSHAAEGRYALVAARLSPEKGVDVAVRAAARAGVPLRIAGEGPASQEIASLARTAGGSAELLGRLDREALARELLGAAMVLMPSRYHEFSPYSALEAMAAGVPVIATRMGGLPELIGAERCVAINDIDDLAGRIRTLWHDPELRRSEGEALLASARSGHAEGRFTRELLGIYERLEAPSASRTSAQ